MANDPCNPNALNDDTQSGFSSKGVGQSAKPQENKLLTNEGKKSAWVQFKNAVSSFANDLTKFSFKS